MGATPAPLFRGAPSDPATLVEGYETVRQTTELICRPLATEDYIPQAMPDVSPPRWHLGHVSWFFEAFLLQAFLGGYAPVNPKYHYLFNSYYQGAGPQYPRAQRGDLSRPTVAEVYAYRAHVDQAMLDLIETTAPEGQAGVGSLIVLGTNHEQQHQELLLTDIKYNLAVNPLRPAYHTVQLPGVPAEPPLRWIDYEGGVHMIGHEEDGFAFDNESPRHQTYLQPYRLGSRLVTNGEYLEFMGSGGYSRPDLWLSDGWKIVQEQRWEAPLYWEQVNGDWQMQTLSGMQQVEQGAPVAHVSYYEADAYARWRGRRLPTESEWEHAAADQPVAGNLLESRIYHPAPAPEGAGLQQLFGDVWEWTQSPYAPYAGFRPWDGVIGEYNGKFMVNQMVLRGGSCVTPQSHIRATYRNFFPPQTRWQFSGIRLADDA